MKPGPVQDQELIADWLPLGVVTERLGISERTVNRMTDRGELQMGYRNIEGRRPAPVFNPSDIERIEAEREANKMFLIPPGGPARTSAEVAGLNAFPKENALVPFPAPSSVSDVILDALPQIAEAFATVRGHEERAAYVDIDEAAKISGLPKGWLLRQARDGAIKSKKLGRWYFQRKALEEL